MLACSLIALACVYSMREYKDVFSCHFPVITELGRSARAFSELSCRTEAMPSDVAMALIEMGELFGKMMA